MRKTFICTAISRGLIRRTSVAVLALLVTYNLSAQASDRYVTDQTAACPPAAVEPSDDSVADPAQSVEVGAAEQAASTPIKSGRSNRPKWKTLLPGTIK